MSTFSLIVFVIVVFVLGLWVNEFKENQCERNGTGEWHYWTQVCEPLNP